jgi:hypothetical protein
VVSVEDMGEFIRGSLAKAYVNATTGDTPYPALARLSKSITEVLVEDECIFSEDIDFDKCQDLLDDLFSSSAPSDRDVMQGAIDQWEGGDAVVVLRDEFYALDNNRFSLTWNEFKEAVKHGNRFFDIHKNLSRETMLDLFTGFFERMEKVIPKGTEMLRARANPKGLFNKDWKRQTLECGPPPPQVAISLRMSPDGISYFYGAEDEITCVKEIRSSSEASVLIGKFQTRRDLKLINLGHVSMIGRPSIFSSNYDHDMNWAHDFLKSFSQEISKPVDEKEAAIEYIPTQIISEYIRLKGYDGVMYKSSLTRKINYTLFCGRRNEQLYEYYQENTMVPDFTRWLKLIDYYIHNPIIDK